MAGIAAATKDELKAVVERAKDANELTDKIRTAALTRFGMPSRRDEAIAEPVVAAEESERDEASVADAERAEFEAIAP